MVKEETTKSTDEDYESDETEEDKITTRVLDPIEDAEILEEFLPRARTSLSCSVSAQSLIASGCTVVLAETGEEGAVAALFLSDQPGEECGDKKGMENFLVMSTGYEVSPLTTQYFNLLLALPTREGTTFEHLMKEAFSCQPDLKMLVYVAQAEEEIQWYMKPFLKKLEQFDENGTRNVHFIDEKDVNPRIHIERANLKDQSILQNMMEKTIPPYPHDISKVLRGFIDTNDEVSIILGSFQEALGVVIVDEAIELEKLNKSWQLSAYNYLMAPTTNTSRKQKSNDPASAANCFKLVSFWMESPSCPIQVLTKLFEKIADKDYCILLLPRDIEPSTTLASLFTRVAPVPESEVSTELYICHKASLRPGIRIGVARSSHLSGIRSLAKQEKLCSTIMTDVNHSLETDGSDATTMVATCYDQVVGVAVFRTEWDIQYLQSNYDTNLGLTPVRLHHLILAPVFQRFARHFLAQILRISNKSSLVYPLFKRKSKSREAERYSPITVLDEFQMVKPRRRIQLSGIKLPKSPSEKATKMLPPFTMFYISRVDAALKMKTINKKIIIIGSSTTTLSAAEYFATKRLHAFPNIYLLTRDDVAQDYGPNIINISPPAWGPLAVGRRSRLSLQSVVNVIIGKVTNIDRVERRIRINSEGSITYDNILLCVESCFYSMSRLCSPRKGLEAMKNYFIIDCQSAGKQCLDWVQSTGENYQKDGYIIVFGFSLHSLAVINSLIEIGAPASCILLVKTENQETHPFYEDGAIRNKILNQLRFLGVRVKAYTFIDFKKQPHLGIIDTIIFSKHDELIEASCIMFVNCSNPTVNPDLVDVVERADLVWLDGRLVVNNQLQTNDKNILAAGTGTRLDKISASIQPSNQCSSPYQIGEQLAATLFENIEGSNSGTPSVENQGYFAVHRECQLPGGFTYLFLSDQILADHRQKYLTTSGKHGEFRLYFDQNEKISGIHCLFHGYLPTENLVQLRGVHRSTFPGLEESEDLFLFFQQPKVLAVFHDRSVISFPSKFFPNIIFFADFLPFVEK